jgi:uncharacterized protein YndB with AHSA1/START domain
MRKNFITVAVTINANAEKAWEYFTNPNHITQWYFALDSWCAPRATNNLKIGGAFSTRMESKDGSMGFDLNGIYTAIILHKIIEYTLEDKRVVKILFETKVNETIITQIFEAETENTLELQKNGWQAILNNYKKYIENNNA